MGEQVMYYLVAVIVGALISYGVQLLWNRRKQSTAEQQVTAEAAALPEIDEPGYSLRIRVNRAPTYTIQTDMQEISLPTKDPNIQLRLRATGANWLFSTVREAKYWVIVGSGFDTEAAAQAEGTRLEQNLIVGLTRAQLGADFGWTGPKGFITPYGEEYFSQQYGKRVLHDAHGLKVFKTSPRPVFMDMPAQPLVGREEGGAIDVLRRTFRENIQLADQETIAYQLYQISTLQSMSELRLILLVTAIESVIPEMDKSAAAVALIDKFEETIKSSSLSPEEIRSFQGSLRHLRKLSIGRAGKTLVDQVVPSTTSYQGMPAGEFFLKVYALRSTLVHGGASSTVRNKIANVIADVELLTRAVLMGLRPIGN
jgi:hypothetical protein